MELMAIKADKNVSNNYNKNDYLNNKPIIVSNFMAILELSKEGLININQDNSYEFLPIYLQLNKTK